MVLRGVALLLLLCLRLASSVKVLTWPPLNCSTQDLRCTVKTSNCMDRSFLDRNIYTPSSPEELQASVSTRRDEAGHLHAVLDAKWTIKDDGSIGYLNATELHVLVMSTNQNLCVRYSLRDKLPMRTPSGEKWSFSANMVMLQPGWRYRVSVFNIPKPELGHSSYDVSQVVVVPDCRDAAMQMTRFCIEGGSLWRSNISLAKVPAAGGGGGSALAVSFAPDALCEEYVVVVSCGDHQHRDSVNAANRTTLNVTFALGKWPSSCCQFNVQVKPLFPQCGHDCTRQSRTRSICHDVPRTDAVPLHTFVILGVTLTLTCAMTAIISFVLCRKPGKIGDAAAPVPGDKPLRRQIQQPPKVLVIYSQDHYLYRDVVLKLCAFLQAKCGTKVLVDLLDSTSVGMVGRLRWLEWQRQQLRNPSDKILVLCSRGVQAKWRALCGQGRVTLREDLLSPTDDMLTPFLHLFLPDMHQAGMQGRYMAAYFDDISGEQDVPSFFDIAVKYKLMKHFEELYFRILDIEKYQPGQVNHIEGIGGDEYFNCPSGRALKDAIDNFQAYQWENPDWFERECVEDEAEVVNEADLLIEQLRIPPVLQFVPLIREGPPVCVREVEIAENADAVYVLTPELSHQHPLASVLELTPDVNPERGHRCLGEASTDHARPRRPGPEPVYTVEPVLRKPPSPRQNRPSPEGDPPGHVPAEDDENDLSQRKSRPPAQSSGANASGDYLPPSGIGCSLPVEMEEGEVPAPGGKGPSSGSDQGYISKMPSRHEAPLKGDALAALARLQEALFQQDLMYSDMDLEGD